MDAELVSAFLKQSTWHGPLEPAEAMLAAYPELASSGIHAAAVLGDDAAVRRFLALDPRSATAKALPYGGDALNYLGAMGKAPAVHTIVEREPHLVGEVIALGGGLLARFCGTDNPPGVRQLLDLGVTVTAPFTEGDGYFGIPERSLPIHVAAWRSRPDVVKLLIERGAPVDLPDPMGRTPLALAVLACVDSYWTEYCSPALIKMLLDAEASVRGARYPSGHPEVDRLLKAHGAVAS